MIKKTILMLMVVLSMVAFTQVAAADTRYEVEVSDVEADSASAELG